MLACEILPKHVSDLLPEMRKLVMGLSIVDRMPQISTASDYSGRAPLARVCRSQHQVWIWLQSNGIETVAPFYPETGKLFYRLPEFESQMPFKPTDFTQVNHMMNRALVSRAIRLLEVNPADHVLDLFCGIGNFTLPLARKAKQVLGIEGLASLTARAKDNAEHNDLVNKVSFMQSDLFKAIPETVASWGKADCWFMDPPRDGAMAICQALAELHWQHSKLLPQAHRLCFL